MIFDKRKKNPSVLCTCSTHRECWPVAGDTHPQQRRQGQKRLPGGYFIRYCRLRAQQSRLFFSVLYVFFFFKFYISLTIPFNFGLRDIPSGYRKILQCAGISYFFCLFIIIQIELRNLAFAAYFHISRNRSLFFPIVIYMR